MPEGYPWYEEVTDGSIDQGDILCECPAGYLPVNWKADNESQRFIVDFFDLIVLTQACDLKHDKIEYVVCCPVIPHTHVDGEYPGRSQKYINNQKDKIVDGLVPGYAMIAEHSGKPSREVSIVDFRMVFSLPKVFIRKIAAEQEHLRLLPPYREHVSQSFARFFMRVGLPVSIRHFAT